MSKLVEVSLPLPEISAACKADKDRKTGTIKNVHKWFAPMPTPAWRALLFAALVDDPGDDDAREELLSLIRKLVPPDGGPPDTESLARARELLETATAGNPPVVFDPFCGGGSTIVEAQRLGLPAIGSDLNPVPALISRVLCELLPQVACRPPLIRDEDGLGIFGDEPLRGFLSDCRHYAQRVRDVVWEQVRYLYPAPPGGGTVIAWLWARTVTCPNPACRAVAPLVSSFWLSKRKGALTWVEPTDLEPGKPARFVVKTGAGGPPPPTKVGRGGTFRCLVCSGLIPEPYVKAEGMAGRLGVQLMAAAVDARDGRRYLAPQLDLEPPDVDRPEDAPLVELPDDMRAFWCKLYGVTTYADVFTNRQLVALSAFAGAVRRVPDWVKADGGDDLYAKAVATVLGLCVSKLSMASSTQGRWNVRSSGSSKAEPAFGRQALPMVWDFAETNPFGGSVGDWLGQLDSTITGLRTLPLPSKRAQVFQVDAREAPAKLATAALIATDPPYFGQIGYADLSDYFYVWLRRVLRDLHPDLFRTVATPKSDELIAAPYRNGGSKQKATAFFVDGFTETFHRLLSIAAPGLPMMVVYAHRQEESDGEGGVTSTAWDAMLQAILAAGLRIVRTWPILGAREARQIGIDANSLATYMILVCRPQVATAKPTDRQGFLAALHAALPKAIRQMQQADISTIDLGPAAIGPGMEVFSRFSKVIEPSGSSLTVGEALRIISQVTGEVLDEFVGELDNETRWAMNWFRDHGFDPGPFDDAEKYFKSMATSLDGVEKAGVARGGEGKVRLTARSDLPAAWSPLTDRRVTVWEVAQYLVKRLDEEGEDAAAELLSECGRWADQARDLVQWLAATALRTRPTEALPLDALVTVWSDLQKKASELRRRTPMSQQGRLEGIS